MDQIRKLSVSERVELIENIWDSIADQPEEIHLTDAQRLELDCRLEAWRDNPHSGSSWETVRERLLNRL